MALLFQPVEKPCYSCKLIEQLPFGFLNFLLFIILPLFLSLIVILYIYSILFFILLALTLVLDFFLTLNNALAFEIKTIFYTNLKWMANTAYSWSDHLFLVSSFGFFAILLILRSSHPQFWIDSARQINVYSEILWLRTWNPHQLTVFVLVVLYHLVHRFGRSIKEKLFLILNQFDRITHHLIHQFINYFPNFILLRYFLRLPQNLYLSL